MGYEIAGNDPVERLDRKTPFSSAVERAALLFARYHHLAGQAGLAGC